MEQQPKFTPRFGSFLILVGIGLLLVFIGSTLAGTPHLGYLFTGLIILWFGSWLRRRTASRQTSGRFRIMRGIYEKSKERQEQKKKGNKNSSHFQ